MKTLALALALAGCTKAAPSDSPRDKPGLAPAPAPAPTPAPPAPAATVTLTSVTFADDCGGTPPWTPPAAAASPAAGAASPAATPPPSRRAATSNHSRPAGGPAARRCEQTSMQLAIVAGTDTVVKVKSVEVLDEDGKALGTLKASTPTRWSDSTSTYETWDDTVAAGQSAQVSYVLQQPSFISYDERRDRTYTVKVVASVGGVDQPLQTTVMVIGWRPPLPT